MYVIVSEYLFRVHQDIAHYLVEKEVDKTRVLYWYHREFIEVAQERYMTDNLPDYIHGLLADYFQGKWSKMVKRPFR